MLYRYRYVKNALLEIDKDTFQFASGDELNDPMERWFIGREIKQPGAIMINTVC